MRSAVLFLACLAVATSAAAATDRQTRTFTWSADRLLSLDITVGRIRIEGSTRTDVELVVQRSAPTTEALSRVPLTVQESADRVDISLVQADRATDPTITTDVVLRVPATARLDRVRIVEGPLVVERFTGMLTADVRRGDIQGTQLAGTLRLETGIGSITLTATRLEPSGLLRLRAFNGHVRLRMPGPPADARVLALALNGTIDSDLPLTVRDSWGPHWSEATLGKGEPVLSIDVVTGTIEIRTR